MWSTCMLPSIEHGLRTTRNMSFWWQHSCSCFPEVLGVFLKWLAVKGGTWFLWSSYSSSFEQEGNSYSEEIHMLPGIRKRRCQWKRGRQPRSAGCLLSLRQWTKASSTKRTKCCIQDMSSQACLSYVGPVRLRFAHPWRRRTGLPRGQSSLARHIRVRKLQVRLWKIESQDIPGWVW